MPPAQVEDIDLARAARRDGDVIQPDLLRALSRSEMIDDGARNEVNVRSRPERNAKGVTEAESRSGTICSGTCSLGIPRDRIDVSPDHEAADPVVPIIREIHDAVRSDGERWDRGDHRLRCQTSIASEVEALDVTGRTARSRHGRDHSVRGHAANPLVARIRDDEGSIRVNRDGLGEIQARRCRRPAIAGESSEVVGSGRTASSQCSQDAIRSDLPHSIIDVFSKVDRSVCANRDRSAVRRNKCTQCLDAVRGKSLRVTEGRIRRRSCNRVDVPIGRNPAYSPSVCEVQASVRAKGHPGRLEQPGLPCRDPICG